MKRNEEKCLHKSTTLTYGAVMEVEFERGEETWTRATGLNVDAIRRVVMRCKDCNDSVSLDLPVWALIAMIGPDCAGDV